MGVDNIDSFPAMVLTKKSNKPKQNLSGEKKPAFESLLCKHTCDCRSPKECMKSTRAYYEAEDSVFPDAQVRKLLYSFANPRQTSNGSPRQKKSNERRQQRFDGLVQHINPEKMNARQIFVSVVHFPLHLIKSYRDLSEPKPPFKDFAAAALPITINARQARNRKRLQSIDFKRAEDELREECNRTLGIGIEVRYIEPFPDEGVQDTKVRRYSMRRKLKRALWKTKMTDVELFYMRQCESTRGVYRVFYAPPTLSETSTGRDERRMAMEEKLFRYVAHLNRLNHFDAYRAVFGHSGGTDDGRRRWLRRPTKLLCDPTNVRYLPKPRDELERQMWEVHKRRLENYLQWEREVTKEKDEGTSL